MMARYDQVQFLRCMKAIQCDHLCSGANEAIRTLICQAVNPSTNEAKVACQRYANCVHLVLGGLIDDDIKAWREKFGAEPFEQLFTIRRFNLICYKLYLGGVFIGSYGSEKRAHQKAEAISKALTNSKRDGG